MLRQLQGDKQNSAKQTRWGKVAPSSAVPPWHWATFTMVQQAPGGLSHTMGASGACYSATYPSVFHRPRHFGGPSDIRTGEGEQGRAAAGRTPFRFLGDSCRLGGRLLSRKSNEERTSCALPNGCGHFHQTLTLLGSVFCLRRNYEVNKSGTKTSCETSPASVAWQCGHVFSLLLTHVVYGNWRTLPPEAWMACLLSLCHVAFGADAYVSVVVLATAVLLIVYSALPLRTCSPRCSCWSLGMCNWLRHST